MLTFQQIRDRLHQYNLTKDYSVLNDVPEEQYCDIMYPDIIRPIGWTTEQYECLLNQLFGKLEDSN